MKHYFLTLTSIVLISTSTPLLANSSGHYSLGTGIFLQQYTPAESYSRSNENRRLAPMLTGSYQHTTWLNSHLKLYSANSHNTRLSGIEYQIRPTYTFNQNKVSLYLAPGFFSESRTDKNTQHDRRENFSGLSLTAGIFKQFEQWQLDISVGIRENTDYVAYYENRTADVKHHVRVTNASLALNYCF